MYGFVYPLVANKISQTLKVCNRYLLDKLIFSYFIKVPLFVMEMVFFLPRSQNNSISPKLLLVSFSRAQLLIICLKMLVEVPNVKIRGLRSCWCSTSAIIMGHKRHEEVWRWKLKRSDVQLRNPEMGSDYLQPWGPGEQGAQLIACETICSACRGVPSSSSIPSQHTNTSTQSRPSPCWERVAQVCW